MASNSACIFANRTHVVIKSVIQGSAIGPIHTIPDSSNIGLLPISDRPSIRTIPDESDMLRIAFAESNHSAVKVVCIGLLSTSDHF